MANQQPARARPKPPPLRRQAWNLARAVADFVADGLRTVTAEQYRKRLEVCDACDQRRGNRCLKCGCRLALKARGRAFRCPLDNWPASGAGDQSDPAPPIPANDDGNATQTAKHRRPATPVNSQSR